MPNRFPLSLLQAVNDVQRGHSSARQRQRRSEALKNEAAKLDIRYRRCGLICFRQIALKKGETSLWELMAKDRLPELISSWTIDLDFAMKLKGGVPPEEWQGIIFCILPKPDQVVAKLHALYADQDFQNAVKRLKPQITAFYDGIGKYGPSQSEVVLEIESVRPDDVYTMGGYSSDKATLACLLLGHSPTPAEQAWVDQNIVRSKLQPSGPWWLSHDGWDNVYKRGKPQIDALKARHNAIMKSP